MIQSGIEVGLHKPCKVTGLNEFPKPIMLTCLMRPWNTHFIIVIVFRIYFQPYGIIFLIISFFYLHRLMENPSLWVALSQKFYQVIF